MLTRWFGAVWHLLGGSAGQSCRDLTIDQQANQASVAGRERSVELREEVAAGAREEGTYSLPDGQGGGDNRSSQLARLVSAYLNVRAEEMLVLLLQELSRETTRELRQAMKENAQSTSAEIAEVREGVTSTQREFSRIGRELVRSGAVLESLQATVSTIGPSVERLETLLQAELARAKVTEERLREEMEWDGLEDMLATLDGLEVGLEHGREIVQSLVQAQHRLKDTTVQRWWRAMGEATGVKRPLPEVPVADVEGWIGGLELTYRRLQDALARRGIVPIEALGRPFDPHVHEAVAVEPCPEEQHGLVLREQRRGYRTSDRVIRLSQVVVGRGEPRKRSDRRRGRRWSLAEQVSENPEP